MLEDAAVENIEAAADAETEETAPAEETKEDEA